MNRLSLFFKKILKEQGEKKIIEFDKLAGWKFAFKERTTYY